MRQEKNRFFGDRAFYASVLAICVPIVIQNGFTNFVNLLDNLMVGRLGTAEMSGVSIANQLIFVFNITIFGVMSGAGIYSAQYFGKKDHEGVRTTMRFKLITAGVTVTAVVLLLSLLPEKLLSLYLTGQGSADEIAATLHNGKEYLRIMLFGLPAFALTQIYSSTLREGSETVLPMKAGVAAIATNLVLNYLLIFGSLGFPEMGTAGAALATVISRWTEAGIVILFSHSRKDRFPFLCGVWSTLRIRWKEFLRILRAAIPMIANESLWSIGMATLMQCYSTRGLSAVAGSNISSTIGNLANVTCLAIGNTIAIMVGQLLGAGKTEEAVETDTRLITFSILTGLATGLLVALSAPFFPRLYNTSQEARGIASSLILAQAVCMPFFAFKNAAYFTLRSGGRIWITILFDSVCLWCVGVPIAFIMSRFTSASVLWIYLAVQLGDTVKCILGFTLVKRRIWVRTIVE